MPTRIAPIVAPTSGIRSNTPISTASGPRNGMPRISITRYAVAPPPPGSGAAAPPPDAPAPPRHDCRGRGPRQVVPDGGPPVIRHPPQADSPVLGLELQ